MSEYYEQELSSSLCFSLLTSIMYKTYAYLILLSWAFRFGDLTKELSFKVKEGVQTFTGKPEWKFGDIAKEIVKEGVETFNGKPEWELGEGDQVSGSIGR